MTRPSAHSAAIASAVLSLPDLAAPAVAAQLAAAGMPISPARVRQIRADARVAAPTGRGGQRSPTSTRSLQALGARVVEIATARDVTPDALLDRATAVVNAGCAMVGCDRAATHAGYTRHEGGVIDALLTCDEHAERGAVEIGR